MAGLLDPPNEEAAAAYHQQVLARFEPRVPLEVRADAGGGRGKGVFATRPIAAGDVVFTERALAGVQHAENKADIPACPHCFRAIASPESVVASLLCSLIGRLSGDDGHGGSGHSNGGAGGSSGGGGGGGGGARAADSDSDDGFSPEEAARRAALIEAAVDARTLQGLIDGSARLPRSELIATPEPVACAGGCGERYCSRECAAAAWGAYHCLLCPVGANSAEPNGGSSSNAGTSSSNSSNKPAASKGKGPLKARPSAGKDSSSSGEDEVAGVTVRRRRLAAFLEHADEANDEFRLAAQVLAIVLVRADAALRAQQQSGGGEGKGDGDGDGAPSEAARTAALREAWLPFAVAEKALYWQVASFDGDDGTGEEEAEYRAQLKELTGESLRLLRAAWPRVRWPELLELDVYGSIVGMFEQNNLALNIPSPAERYFGLPLDADALPDPAERSALAREQRPLRDALAGELEAASVEGTAFYALHSCCNHACAPSAAAEGDPSGAARIVALRDIAAGDEVTLSYVEVGGCNGVAERRAALRSYGFECACELCEADALAAGVGAL